MTRAACKRNIFVMLALFILVQFVLCEDINKGLISAVQNNKYDIFKTLLEEYNASPNT